MALDDATTAFLTQMAEAGAPPLHESSPQEARLVTAGLKDMYGPGPEMAKAQSYRVDVEGGQIDVQVLVPTEEPVGVMVYFHGGGWVIGQIDEFETLGRQLAHRTNHAVVLVDYRLAPEHPYPTAVDDSWSALQWVEQEMESLVGKRLPLVVGGDSAGGNIAAILSQRAIARGGPEITRQVLVYPVTDADFERPSYVAAENQLMLSKDSMVWFWDHYAPNAADRQQPDASPLRAQDLAGLPPAIILTAEHDVLCDEGEEYAAALREAGVPVVHRRFDGQMHGFFTMVNLLPGAAAGLDFVTAELARPARS
ncbi:alpha/beta hydrolase [Nocardioides sp. BGMRC 2183]|nr:alpha/beta hydrolase [Nocardioides sp. BGMRC 2183]